MKRIILIVGAMAALTFFFTGCIQEESQFREVKSAVLAGNVKLNTNIEWGFGPVSIWVAGTVLKFVDEPEPQEARDYIKHVSKVNIGVYEVHGSWKSKVEEISQGLDASMKKIGYEPLVRVKERKEFVGVFVPEVSEEFPRQVFVVVMDRNDLVLVQARGNFEKLAKAVLRNHPLDLADFNKVFEDSIVL